MVLNGASRPSAGAKSYSQAVGVALSMTRGIAYSDRVCRGVE